MSIESTIKLPTSFRQFQSTEEAFETTDQFPQFVWDLLVKAKAAPLTLKRIAAILNANVEDALLITDQLKDLGMVEEIDYPCVAFEKPKEKPKVTLVELTQEPEKLEVSKNGAEKNGAVVEDLDISVKCSSSHNNHHAVHMVIE